MLIDAAQLLTSFYTVCGALFSNKRESTEDPSVERCARQRFVPSWLGIFRQLFLTKLGIVVHHHEPECHAEILCSRSMSQPRLQISINISLDDIF